MDKISDIFMIDHMHHNNLSSDLLGLPFQKTQPQVKEIQQNTRKG